MSVGIGLKLVVIIFVYVSSKSKMKWNKYRQENCPIIRLVGRVGGWGGGQVGISTRPAYFYIYISCQSAKCMLHVIISIQDLARPSGPGNMGQENAGMLFPSKTVELFQILQMAFDLIPSCFNKIFCKKIFCCILSMMVVGSIKVMMINPFKANQGRFKNGSF